MFSNIKTPIRPMLGQDSDGRENRIATRRRNFLLGSAAVAGGITLGSGTSVFSGEAEAAQEKSVDTLAPYTKLDPEAVKPAARKNYGAGMHCGEGTFHTIVAELREKEGKPYTQIPTTIIWPAAGGGALQGATCGTLVGGMGAIGLVHGRSSTTMKLVNELLLYYEQTKLPQYQPPETAQGITKSLPAVEPGSPLCHVSVSKRSEAADLPSDAPERAERCGRLTADITAKTVELLNAEADGTFEREAEEVSPPESISATHGCRSCHSVGKPKNLGGTTLGKMPCRECHGSKHGWLSPSERGEGQ